MRLEHDASLAIEWSENNNVKLDKVLVPGNKYENVWAKMSGKNWGEC